MAPELAAWYDTYRDRGLTVITLMSENNSYETPTAEEMMGWANDAGADHPILADPGAAAALEFIRADPAFDGGYGLPSMQMLSPGMVVESVNSHVGSAEFEPLLPN